MARNILGIQDANSSEFSNCNNSIVGLMTEWTTSDNTTEKRSKNDDLGGTMRLGSYEAKLEKAVKYIIYIKTKLSMKDIVTDMKLTINLLKNLRTKALSSLVIHLMDCYLKLLN